MVGTDIFSRCTRAGSIFLFLSIMAVPKVFAAGTDLSPTATVKVEDQRKLEVYACTPHGTTVTFVIQEFGQVRSERSTLTPGESASFEIAEGNMNDWTCIAKFELQNSTTRYHKVFPLWGPHGPKCRSCRWIFKDFQSGIFLDSHDGRGPVHVLDWDVDVDTNKQLSFKRD